MLFLFPLTAAFCSFLTPNPKSPIPAFVRFFFAHANTARPLPQGDFGSRRGPPTASLSIVVHRRWIVLPD